MDDPTIKHCTPGLPNVPLKIPYMGMKMVKIVAEHNELMALFLTQGLQQLTLHQLRAHFSPISSNFLLSHPQNVLQPLKLNSDQGGFSASTDPTQKQHHHHQ